MILDFYVGCMHVTFPAPSIRFLVLTTAREPRKIGDRAVSQLLLVDKGFPVLAVDASCESKREEAKSKKT